MGVKLTLQLLADRIVADRKHAKIVVFPFSTKVAGNVTLTERALKPTNVIKWHHRTETNPLLAQNGSDCPKKNVIKLVCFVHNQLITPKWMAQKLKPTISPKPSWNAATPVRTSGLT